MQPNGGKNNINYTELTTHSIGQSRREELALEGFYGQGYTPKLMSHEDYDKSFLEWCKKELEISYNGELLPVQLLMSIQRLSEYSKLWKITNSKGGLINNFVAIQREINPKGGSIMGDGMRNIPGEQFWPIGYVDVIENTLHSVDVLEMKQPVAVDFKYTVSIFCNKMEIVNKFNLMVIDRFKALEAYLHVNDTYYVSMQLDNISDEGKYEIEDRRYYTQSYDILVKGYLLQENDFRRRRMQTRQLIAIDADSRDKACVTIEEDDCCEKLSICLDFRANSKPFVKFRCDETMFVTGVTLENIKSFEMRRDREDEWMKFGAPCKEDPYYFCLYNHERIEVRKVIKDDDILRGKIIFNGVGCKCTNPPYNTEIDQDWLDNQYKELRKTECVFPKNIL
jgi:hypothetical protein